MEMKELEAVWRKRIKWYQAQRDSASSPSVKGKYSIRIKEVNQCLSDLHKRTRMER